MKYALLIYSKPDWRNGFSEEEREAMFGEYVALNDDSRCVASGQLQPVETATTVRVQDGQTLTTDGPFADTKEAFAGYYVYGAGALAETVQVASRAPAARLGGGVGVPPIVEM